METIFEKIIRGEIPAAKIYEDDHFIAILDVFPITTGHTLVIPKKTEAHIIDLEEETYSKLMLLTKKLSKHIQQKLSCKRICLAVVGWEIPHVHVHIVPTNSEKDLPLPGPATKRKKAEPEELKSLSETLKF